MPNTCSESTKNAWLTWAMIMMFAAIAMAAIMFIGHLFIDWFIVVVIVVALLAIVFYVFYNRCKK